MCEKVIYRFDVNFITVQSVNNLYSFEVEIQLRIKIGQTRLVVICLDDHIDFR